MGAQQKRKDGAEQEPGSCACAPCPPVSAQLHRVLEDLGSKYESRASMKEKIGWLRYSTQMAVVKKPPAERRLRRLKAASFLTSEIRESSVGEREAALKKWV